MANEFETLKDMGIDNPHDIEKYSSRIEGDTDILKIYFHRHSGDWFQKNKKYKFKRLEKRIRVNEANEHYRDVTESSPYFLRAVAELDRLVSQEQTSKDKKELMLDELEHLEKVVSRKIEDLRRQIEEM